jgi:hypothetical protein
MDRDSFGRLRRRFAASAAQACQALARDATVLAPIFVQAVTPVRFA